MTNDSAAPFRGSHIILPANGRTTRAITSTNTFAAPARFSTLAHAFTVAPVVNTSSTSKALRPAMADLWRAETRNAPCILRRRAFAEGIAPWLRSEEHTSELQ